MKNRISVFVLAILMSLTVPAVFSNSDTLFVDYTFNAELVDGCGPYTVEGTMLEEIAGEPLMPYYPAAILLPQDAVVKDVKVKTGAPLIQTGIDIPWGQPPCTFSDEPVKVGKNESIYNSDFDYPNTLYQVVSVESFRGFQILHVNLYPMQYKPKSGTVKYYETMTVEVKFGKGLKNKLYRGLYGDKVTVSGMVDNADMVEIYEDGIVPSATEEYIIITNDTLQPTFQTLATWKANFVNGAGVYTVSWIYNNYTGVDNQDKIRNFIIDKYTNNGTKYVLLGGDTGVVPYRGFYIYTGGYTDSDMAADMYFAHLDGSHNADGDSRYGETNDNVDFYAEVAVGRAPVDNTTEAAAFVDKVKAYECMDKPERVCLHQSRVMSGNSPDSRCLAWNCDDYIPGTYTIDYLFEEDGNVSKTDWRNAWAAGPIAVVHIGHGSTTVYHINYEVGGTVSWYNSDVSSLTNTFYPWTTSVACITGQFTYNDCLAEEYVKDDCGAIGAIYNDNYGWFSTLDACMYSGEFCEMEVRACWSDGYEKLGDLLNMARSYLVSSAQSNSYYRWCFYERNLIGDPEIPCLTSIPPRDTVTITNPSDGETVSGTVSVTTSITGDINSVKFYIDDVFKAEDTAAPFQYIWDTTTYPDGNHTVKAEGYVDGVLADDDSVTVIIDICPCYIVITNPSEGETVSGIYTCTADSNCDSVKWYIDDVFKAEDTAAPFQYIWDTTTYPDGGHTVKAEGYRGSVHECEYSVNVTIEGPPPPYVTITYPHSRDTISGVVTVTTDTSGIDEVRFYVNNTLKYTDTTEPFTWDWDTTQYKNKGGYTLKVEGYNNSVYQDYDEIRVKIRNNSIALLSFLIFFLFAGIYKRY